MESSQSTNTPQRLTESALARELKVSRQAVHELVKRGKLQKGDDGLIDAAAARLAILNGVHPGSKTAAALQSSAPAAAPPAQPPASQHSGDSTTDPQITSYHVAKTLREATEAQIAKLKLSEMRGELIRVDAIRSALAGMIAGTRDSLLQIPARLAPVLAVESDAARVHDMIQAELHQALAQLSASPDRITRLEQEH